MKLLKTAVKKMLERTPFQLRRRLPESDLEPIQIVLAFYAGRGQQVNLIQIGACDGTSRDPIFRFVRAPHVRAVQVEPIPASFQRLSELYAGVPNVQLVQAAVAQRDGRATMYKAKESGRWKDSRWAPQLASFDRRHLTKHGLRREEIEEISVPAISLATLQGEAGMDRLDILQIDAEGFDAEIVQMAMELPELPRCINFEFAHLEHRKSKETFEILSQRGYTFTHDDWNSLAVHKSLQDEWLSDS